MFPLYDSNEASDISEDLFAGSEIGLLVDTAARHSFFPYGAISR